MMPHQRVPTPFQLSVLRTFRVGHLVYDVTDERLALLMNTLCAKGYFAPTAIAGTYRCVNNLNDPPRDWDCK